MNRLRPATLSLPRPREFLATWTKAGFTRAEAKALYARLKRDEVYINELYQVNVDRDYQHQPYPGVRVVHLSIKQRADRGPASRDWRHLQEIKNQLFSPEHEAMEIFPAESRLVDVANQTHLWVFTRAEDGGPVDLQVGFRGPRAVSDESSNGAVQRPRNQE